MPDSSVPINAPTTVGQSMASFQDASLNEHEKMVVEYMSGGQPEKVDDTAHPFPVTDAQALTALLSLVGLVLTDAELRANPVPVTISGGGGGAVTIADGADVTLGALADAIVAAGAAGSISAKLRRATQGLEDLKTLIVLAAGANIIGKVGIDQTTPGTTNGVQVNNTVTTSEATPTTIFNGKTQVVTAGTRVVLAASQVVKSVTIKAALANTGTIYVGNATVAAANGFELGAGDTISMEIANLNTVNLDASINAQSCTYIAIN